jgi:NADH dehydrogenase
MMRVAVTGGTGFVGGAVVEALRNAGHEAIALGRNDDIAAAFAGCEAVVHCAGINRELGIQTYQAVHVELTRRVVGEARAAGVRRIALISFLRARPACGSAYHESKWAAEEVVRGSGLDWTIVKPGVIYGRGDHLLDHLSRSFRTLPIFGLVGLRARSLRPVAVGDAARILAAGALGDERLRNRTFPVLGPDELSFRAVIDRVSGVVGRRPIVVPMPVAAARLVAGAAELTMVVPLISSAQVRILAEGVVEPILAPDTLPDDLVPRMPFDEASIRAGLPDPGGFSRADLRWCTR